MYSSEGRAPFDEEIILTQPTIATVFVWRNSDKQMYSSEGRAPFDEEIILCTVEERILCSGPYYWVKCKPDKLIPVSQPNQGSVRGRKEKKRIKQRKDFIMDEKKKRRAQYSTAVKRKEAEQTERKMAAVARERA
ncbi:hypothetical protein ZEAMMB73_Zm00001d020015 [Zea mays]|uniref:Uncharacterized protein n=1 Tax=Zea mays TaxID=4577 RepID=A0A1D6I1L7_MAIZE|nr:hypothetical protein ZEAMMB73_Zm00001d020015 [Zea mays]